MKKFYQLTSQDEQNAELYIYGDITSYKWFEDDVVAYDLAKELDFRPNYRHDDDNYTVEQGDYS